MVRLRIELRCKSLDLFTRDNFFRALKTHPDSKIVEPFDHGLLHLSYWRTLERQSLFRMLSIFQVRGPNVISARQEANVGRSNYRKRFPPCHCFYILASRYKE